jgi:dolichol-phosphate mannosyltransferase
MQPSKLAVVIPCYRVKAHILGVLERIGPECWRIYVVDDKCPENTGDYVRAHCIDPRVRVLYNRENRGVGGAVCEGYRIAIADGAAVIVKIDGDGQMDPGLIREFVRPIVDGEADYTKGNRFYDPAYVAQMPLARICGNAALSFLTKLSSGYWESFDPTNGYTAIHASVAAMLPFSKISKRYFFESDMLFRLNTIRAVVRDIPMRSVYGAEVSNLHIGRILPEFAVKHVANTVKRICYNYYLRNFSLASLELVIGIVAIGFGSIFGAIRWSTSLTSGVGATAGTVMLAALPVMLGIQFILAFVNYDIISTPRYPIGRRAGRLLQRMNEEDDGFGAASRQPVAGDVS